MEKIRNIYCRNHLNDWMEAQRMGLVHVIEAKQSGAGMFGWEQKRSITAKRGNAVFVFRLSGRI